MGNMTVDERLYLKDILSLWAHERDLVARAHLRGPRDQLQELPEGVRVAGTTEDLPLDMSFSALKERLPLKYGRHILSVHWPAETGVHQASGAKTSTARDKDSKKAEKRKHKETQKNGLEKEAKGRKKSRRSCTPSTRAPGDSPFDR